MREEGERHFLSPYASLAAVSRGRERPERLCHIRTAFQRDRDRIIHSKAFRRLKDKTQVFLAPAGDHFRTRLTHTLEVSQISRTIARAAGLNEDLTEAIALGHDLGHTPFGHAGEEVLREVHPGGFNHNQQSLRVVDVLEKDGGLNLTWEVRDGIANHTGPVRPGTLEGEVVRLSDRIAYINHDIDDAIRGGVLGAADLPPLVVGRLGSTHTARINTLVEDCVFESYRQPWVRLSQPVQEAMDLARKFLFDHVYLGSGAKREEEKAKNLLRSLYVYYRDHPEQLYDGHGPGDTTPSQAVVDYLAGMTDRFCIERYNELFVPSPWRRG